MQPPKTRVGYPPPSRHTTIEAALAEALSTRGVSGLAIQADGEVHRFDAPDKKRGNLNGWYVCLTMEVAVFGFWHTDERQTVTLAGKHDPLAALEVRQAVATARRERDARRQREQSQAALQAQETWAMAQPADPLHPYLRAKAVAAHHLRQQGQALLVPLYAGGELINLQRIFPDGGKRFLKRAQLKGAVSMVGRLSGASRVYVTEGWATAVTIHEASGCPVIATMTASNLVAVAPTLRRQLPSHVEIIIAADNDRGVDGNPGLTNARLAAEMIGAHLTWPRFPCEACSCTDFNDLAACEGRMEIPL